MPAASSAPVGHLEIETKLEADPGFAIPDLAGLAGLPDGARIADPLVLHLRALYFDTRRLDLVRSKVTLRRREGGIDDGWHLKLPAGAGARRELGVPLVPGDRPAGSDGHAAAIPEALTSLVAGLTRGRRLRPVAEFATTRIVRRVVAADGTLLVEIADDAVTATRLLPQAQPDGSSQAWRELEVEVLEGTQEQMAAVCRALIVAGARPSGSASKLARALGMDADPSSAAGATELPTAAEVVTAGLRTYRQQLIIADVALRHDDPEAEALHDARAAARRIRSVLTVYDPLFQPGSTRRLARDLRRMGSLIGATRDLDVVTERVLAALNRIDDAQRAGGGDDASAQHQQVIERSTKHRRRHLARLRDAITDRGHLKALRALDEMVDAPPWTLLADRPAAEVLPPMLVLAWSRLRALAEAALADPETPHKAHEVRKAAKTVRYAAETAVPALGPSAAVLADVAERVQDVLGAHQDAVTTVAALAPDARAQDIVGTGTLTPEVADLLRRDELREADRTFNEFAALWAQQPELPH